MNNIKTDEQTTKVKKEIRENTQKLSEVGFHDKSENSDLGILRDIVDIKQQQLQILNSERSAYIEYIKTIEDKKYKKKSDIIEIGSKVTISKTSDGSKITFTISKEFLNLKENIISSLSPLAKACLGKKVSDIVIVESDNRFEIEILEIE